MSVYYVLPANRGYKPFEKKIAAFGSAYKVHPIL
jgi:hypothetical protein